MDLYKVLGVDKQANQKEIKAAFRKLAKKYHPDHNPDNKSAQAKFAEVSQAYEILGNEQKRKQYDMGEIDHTGKPAFGGFGSYSSGGAGNGQWQNPFSSAYGNATGAGFSGTGFDAGDLFRDIFGMGAGARRTARAAKLNKDIKLDVMVSLKDVIQGNKISINLPSGKNLKIQLPKYVSDGQVVRLRGQGEDIYKGPVGDALVSIRFKKDRNFEIRGEDLYSECDLPLHCAVLGGKIMVKTVEGEAVLNIPSHTNSGKTFRLKGKGLPKENGGRGDLYIKMLIMLPEIDSEQYIKLKSICN